MDQPTAHDIVIRLHLGGEESLHPKDLFSAFDALESALYDSDRRDIEKSASAFNIPSVVIDACLERLRHYRNDRILFTSAESGSIVISGMVAGVSYFVLQKTLGDVASEAYKNSEFRESLLKFFTALIDEKAFFIAERLRAASRAQKNKIDVKLKSSTGDAPAYIIVDAEGRPATQRQAVASIGQQLDCAKRKL